MSLERANLSSGSPLLLLTRSALNAGILFMPACCARLGPLPFIAVVGLSGVITNLSLQQLRRVGEVTGTLDYVQLSVATMRSPWPGVTAILISVVQMVSLIINLRMIGDWSVALTQNYIAMPVVSLLAILLSAPWCLGRAGSAVRYLWLGVVAALLIMVVISLEACLQPAATEVAPSEMDPLMAAITTILFTFSTHLSLSVNFRATEISLSVLLAGAAYVILGLAGWRRWGSGVTADILQAPLTWNWVQKGLQIIMILVNTHAIPHLQRQSDAPKAKRKMRLSDELIGEDTAESHGKWLTFGRLSVAWMLACLLPSTTTRLFDLVGAWVGMPIALLLPTWFQWRIQGGVSYSGILCIITAMVVMFSSLINW